MGKSGWLMCEHVAISALEAEDHLVLEGMTDEGMVLDSAQCRRLFDLPGETKGDATVPPAVQGTLNDAVARQVRELMEALAAKNGMWFETEMDKLDRWAEDRRASLKAELDELDEAIKDTKKAARLAPNLPEKLERQRALRQLETKRTEAWKAFDEASQIIDKQKDALLDEISRKLDQRTDRSALFTIHWQVA